MAQIDKAPVLSVKQVDDWVDAQGKYPNRALIYDINREAQRDADALYYEGKYERRIEELEARVKQCLGVIDNLKSQLKEQEQARAEVLKEVERTLSLSENEMGFCEISNHIDYGNWQALKSGKEVVSP